MPTRRSTACRAARRRYLLNDILRGELGFTGTVVSDYFTLPSLHNYHNIAASPREAAKLGLTPASTWNSRSTTCSARRYTRLSRQAKYRSSLSIVQFGAFFAQSSNSACSNNRMYDTGAAATEFDTPDDRALAREIACASIVMLKNENQLLPLSG